MTTPDLAHYPEDRSELFEGPSEEEAHFYFTMNDFENLILTYGPDFVLNKVRYPVYMRLYNYFESL